MRRFPEKEARLLVLVVLGTQAVFLRRPLTPSEPVHPGHHAWKRCSIGPPAPASCFIPALHGLMFSGDICGGVTWGHVRPFGVREARTLSPCHPQVLGLPHAVLPSYPWVPGLKLPSFHHPALPDERGPLGLRVLPPGGHRAPAHSGVAAAGLAGCKRAPLSAQRTFAGRRTARLQRLPSRRHGSFVIRPKRAAEWVRILVLPLLTYGTLGRTTDRCELLLLHGSNR